MPKIPNVNVIQVADTKFSVDCIDEILQCKKPGNYTILWQSGKVYWEIKVKWDGTDWIDARVI